MYRQSPLGPADPSIRALSGRLKFTVRRHYFNEDYLFLANPSAESAPLAFLLNHWFGIGSGLVLVLVWLRFWSGSGSGLGQVLVWLVSPEPESGPSNHFLLNQREKVTLQRARVTLCKALMSLSVK